jgi:hypothetical protein
MRALSPRSAGEVRSVQIVGVLLNVLGEAERVITNEFLGARGIARFKGLDDVMWSRIDFSTRSFSTMVLRRIMRMWVNRFSASEISTLLPLMRMMAW